MAHAAPRPMDSPHGGAYVAIVVSAVIVLVLVAQAQALAMNVVIFLVANLIFGLDFLDMVMRFWLIHRNTGTDTGRDVGPTSIPLDVGRFTPHQIRMHLKPYAVVVSVHNAEYELDDFLDAMAPFKDRLYVIDDASGDTTWFRLNRAGLRCVRATENSHKPGAIRELLKHLPGEIETVFVIDPDVRFCGKVLDPEVLERVLFTFQRSRRAALCPRIVVRPDGWLPTLQRLEYLMSFDIGRRSLSDVGVTSGIAIYRRDALEKAMEHHSLSVYAEDLENSFLLLEQEEGVYYDERLVVETEGKRTWREWFSQRVGWSFGLLRVYFRHFRPILRHTRGRFLPVYQYCVYLGGLSILAHPLKLLSLGVLGASLLNGVDSLLGVNVVPDLAVSDPVCFVYAYMNYTAIVTVALVVAGRRGERAALLPVIPLYFLYALAHIVPTGVGYANWVTAKTTGRRIYRDHFDHREPHGLESRE